MTVDSQALISTLIHRQFPIFYNDEGPLFIQFAKSYYQWLEQTNNINYYARNLLNIKDIDKSPNNFLIHFKDKYISDIQFATIADQRLIIKHATDLYRAKGSEEGLRLFFQLVFGKEIDLYYPKVDIFKTSDNKWIIPYYLEVTDSPLLASYASQEIYGSISGATAFVDAFVIRKTPNKYINLFYISNISGIFIPNEALLIQGGTKNQVNAPFIVGSMANFQILQGGQGFTVGEVVNIVSNNGILGQGLVSGVTTTNNVLTFNLQDGGYGYSLTPTILISNNILSLSNVVITNTSIRTYPFYKFETVKQPLANITFFAANNNFAVGEIIQEWSNTTTISGQGVIISLSQANGSNSGSLLAAPTSGNLGSQNAFFTVGNGVTASVNVYTDVSATGNVMGFAPNAVFYVKNQTGAFLLNETLKQVDANNNPIGTARFLVSSTANNQLILSVANLTGVFFAGNNIIGSVSGVTANLNSYSIQIGVVNVNNSFVAFPNNYLQGINSTTNSVVTFIANTTGASFNIGSLANTETIWENNDFLYANNSGGVPYMSMFIDGHNSNVAGNAYGFPANTTLGLANVIDDCLTFNSTLVGQINSIANITPANTLVETPMIEIMEKFVYGYDYYDDLISINNLKSTFAVNTGEIITQNVPRADLVTLAYTNAVGSFKWGELVFQSNGTANVGTGQIYALNSTSMDLNYVTGSFSTSFQIEGRNSTANAKVASVNNSVVYTAKGLIKPNISNNSVLHVRRLKFTQNFTKGDIIIGSSSNSTANAYYIDNDYSTLFMGDNALVGSNVVFANGAVANLTIYNSGIGYVNGEIASFVSLDGTQVGDIEIFNEGAGHSTGFFDSHSGFLDSDKYLYDGIFYQDFSYQLKTPLDFTSYETILKRVMHVAGLALFGEFRGTSIVMNANGQHANVACTSIKQS